MPTVLGEVQYSGHTETADPHQPGKGMCLLPHYAVIETETQRGANILHFIRINSMMF